MNNLLVFHPALAPYRIDFFNALTHSFNANFYFSYSNLKDQNFDQQHLRSLCHFEFRLLENGLEIGSRSIRTGIWKIIRKHKPDIILCSEYSQITLSVLMLRFLFRKKFKVYTISDDSIDLSIKRKGIRKWLRNIVSFYIDGVIFPSESVCDWYHQQVNVTTTLFSLPIVHDNDAFRLKLQNTLPVANIKRLKYGLQNKKVFLFVGRLVKIKNIKFLINAFAASLDQMPDAVLVIIGEGEENEVLHKLAKELGVESKCLFLGRLEGDALHEWFNIAHCLVLPSYQEPYGAVVNEALLAGCKVLCSKLAGASELITSYNGAIFDPFNLKELSELLIMYYHNTIIKPQQLEIRSDLMPFKLSSKLNSLVENLKF